MPLAIPLPAGREVILSGFVFDSSTGASAIRFEGGSGTELTAGGSRRRRSLQATNSTPEDFATLFTITDGAPPVFLDGLVVRGAIFVAGGEFVATNCTFNGTDLGETRGLVITGGDSHLDSSTIAKYENGGITIEAGELAVTRSRIVENGHGATSTYGGILVGGDGAVVSFSETDIEYNGRISNECAMAVCVRGGGLKLAGWKIFTGRY